MNYEEVQTFLSVLEYGSIVKGAKRLFIGQGTASSRIKHLEEELGVTLFNRQPGLNNLSLTEAGKEFLEIAHRYMEVNESALKLKEKTRKIELNIASLDMINHFVFRNRYIEFIRALPNVSLNIQTYHSSYIHELINQMRFDVGFVFSLYNYPNITAEKISSEKMSIVYFKGNPFAIEKRFDLLNHNEEIFIKWSSDFQQWHNNFFTYRQKKVTIGTAALLKDFLLSEENWSIVPESVAKEVCTLDQQLNYFVIEGAPTRNLYSITNINLSKEKKEYIDWFLKRSK